MVLGAKLASVACKVTILPNILFLWPLKLYLDILLYLLAVQRMFLGLNFMLRYKGSNFEIFIVASSLFFKTRLLLASEPYPKTYVGGEGRTNVWAAPGDGSGFTSG